MTPDATCPDRAETPSLMARFMRSPWAYAAISLLLLAPCYWQPRIQAGDLSSHIYNSWLAQVIESGRAQGLIVAPQFTNVLFDLLLGGLFKAMGAEAAQRIAVGFAVLVFIWGAFAFTSAAAGRKVWNLLPCIAMLAYGWVFHMGFFNFYLALGLCFWALALAWSPSPRRLAGAVALLAVAYLAHGLPVAWCAFLLVYYVVARRLSPVVRSYVTLGAMTAMALVRVATQAAFSTQWYPAQLTYVTGVDQVWVFDAKYYAVLVCLLFVWGVLFLNLIHKQGASRVFRGIPFQFFVMSAGGVVILPSTVLIPGFLHALAFIAERMSLGVGICVCALLGAARPRAFERWAIAAVALMFFVFLYHDERALNAFEDRMEGAVAHLPSNQRVIAVVSDPDLRANAITHMIDRACLGRCFSFANYEPSTWQFRIRAIGQSSVVVNKYSDSWALQTGTYMVKPSDLPLYAVDVDDSGRIIIRQLKAGALCGSSYWKVLPPVFPFS